MWHEVLYVFDGCSDGLRLKARLLSYLAMHDVPNVIESYFDGIISNETPEHAEASIAAELDTLPVLIYCETENDAEELVRLIAAAEADLPKPFIKPLPAYATENAWSDGSIFQTQRFVLSPDPSVEVREDQFLIRLQPGKAFGSGQHVTTIAMLRAMETHLTQAPKRVLDIGTGNGVLLIAAAMLGAEALKGTDLTAEIVNEARSNLALNSVSGDLLVSDQIPAPDKDADRFDLVMANIPVTALRPLMPQIVKAATPNGKILLSGFNAADGHVFGEELRQLGLRLKSQTDERGWVALLLEMISDDGAR